MLEVEVEFKEEEHVGLDVLEVKVEFKEGEEDEQVILGLLEVEWSSRRKRRRNR